ncbi:Phosphoribosylformylglycinamidine cyclo-ligase [Trinorchestia longiramus]|nr:Phosphoribosylformylglycinamidine cyclo-ligase [Trinorchestia longiramus]
MAIVLVLGSGGREHAIVHALSLCSSSGHGGSHVGDPGQDEDFSVEKIFVAPGNAGIQLEQNVECVSLDVKDHESVASFCRVRSVGLVVVGPEAPLAAGIADALTAAGILVFGPSKKAASLESDKSFAKDFMRRHEIPTAASASFSDSESAKAFIRRSDWGGWAVKAAGLAAGKGVVVAGSKDEACAAVEELQILHPMAATTLVVEERLHGTEVSALCLTDGRSIAMLPPSQDHKTRYSHNRGPNTGGMGAVCPYPLEDATAALCRDLLQATVDGMASDGTPFCGVLYAGLMLCEDGVYACALGRLSEAPPVVFPKGLFSCAVVVVTQDYPQAAQTGLPITGLNAAQENADTNTHVKVYHNSTKRSSDGGGGFVTAGGRVVTVVVTAPCASTARLDACRRAACIKFEGADWRDDIGQEAETEAQLGVLSPNQSVSGDKDVMASSLTYSASGVDVAAGDAFVKAIKESVAATQGPAVLGGLGDFGGFFDLSVKGMRNPVLVTGADGVGTKLMVANAVGKHNSVGQDLVAMCLNDIQCHGAVPLVFLDYLATGKLQPHVLQEVVQGIARSCQETGAALIGGETAEMPGMYQPGEYDVAGFAVGVVEKEDLLPKRLRMRPGDCVIGICSSGFHSNGFSLVRRVVDNLGLQYSDPCPFDPTRTLGDVLLTPTRLYSKVFAKIRGRILGAAHITGGGLVGNAARMLPPHLVAHLDVSKWSVPPEFVWIAGQGVAASEMARTFNLGLGLLLTVRQEMKEEVLQVLEADGAREVGRLVATKGTPNGGTRVILEGLEQHLQEAVSGLTKSPCIRGRVRTAIFISGRGSNMEAIVSACEAAGSPAEVCLVLSNRPGAPGLMWAQQRGVPTVVVDHKSYGSREDFETAAQEELERHGAELVCLAGFMRILTEGFVRQWRGRLINIHPSLLPAFKGKDAQKQALQAGVKISGCTVHYVEVRNSSLVVLSYWSVVGSGTSVDKRCR